MHELSKKFLSSQEAAARGDRDAEFELGLMYGLGLGVAQSYTESLKWYERAARRGCDRAQVNLGFMFGTGRGAPQDFVRAYAWYNVAAAGGNETARKNRDIVAEDMSKGQLEKAQILANELYESLSDDRDQPAEKLPEPEPDPVRDADRRED